MTPPTYYHCAFCGYVDRDPEAVFGHMQRRECRKSDGRVPTWVQRAQRRELPAKELAA